ncbi:hypothetical protein Dimus_005567 [Dionaea muscipula]
MVGRREPSQRRIVEACFDSRSPGPRHPVMFRGSLSPPITFHHRPAPSLGPRARRPQRPSPVLSSSVDPGEVSSSEMGEGDSMEIEVTSSEEEGDGLRREVDGLWREDDGKLVSSCLPDLSPSSSISGSPPLSPAATVRICQAAMDAGGQDFVSSLLTSTLVEEGRAEPGVGDSTGDEAPMVELPRPTASLAGGCEDCSTVEPIITGSGLREVAGGESAQVAAVVNDEISRQRSKVRVFSQLPSASIDGRLGGSPAFLESGEADVVDGRYVRKGLQNLVNLMLQPDSLVIGSDKPTVSVPCSDAVLPLPGGLVHRAATLPSGSVHREASLLDGRVSRGSVSEEGRVLPVAKEALRPQPTDGLRQRSSTPVEPMSAVEGGSVPLPEGLAAAVVLPGGSPVEAWRLRPLPVDGEFFLGGGGQLDTTSTASFSISVGGMPEGSSSCPSEDGLVLRFRRPSGSPGKGGGGEDDVGNDGPDYGAVPTRSERIE